MKNYQKLPLALVLLFLTTAAFALQMKSLYRAEVPVPSQQAAARAEGLRAALMTVLVKVSGNEQIEDNSVIQSKLDSAEALVNEFGYATVPAGSGGGLNLWVNFDPEGINALLSEAGVPVWGEERPLILVWLVNTVSGEEQHILTEDQDMAFAQAFKAAAKQRGLPVIFPLMDLKDMAVVSPQSVVSSQYPALLQAAKRYASGAMLVGQIIPVPAGLRMSASLTLGGEHWQWDVTGADPAEVSAALSDRMAGILSAHFAAAEAADAGTTLQLTVDGIHGAEDMTALTGYLQHLTSVEDADILQVLGNSVVLELHLRGSMAAFNREIAAGQHLAPVPQQSLEYEWKG